MAPEMIHVCTVHWQEEQWIDVQLDYLRRHLQRPHRVYASLAHIPVEHGSKYFYSNHEPIQDHGTKLNLLGEMACIRAESPGDWLLFLDSDAFPIGDLTAYLDDRLSEFPLIAVQRLEQDGDIQPHPCFCATTVGFWQEIQGDWKKGGTWINDRGQECTDPGGNLLHILNDRGVNWYKMLRTNQVNLHPVNFGIYDHMIYHHGGTLMSYVETNHPSGSIPGVDSFGELYKHPLTRIAWHTSRALWWFGQMLEKFRVWLLDQTPLRRRWREVEARNKAMSEELFKEIVSDPAFHQSLSGDRDPGRDSGA